jgi:mono/diheme cytochrome c family protein
MKAGIIFAFLGMSVVCSSSVEVFAQQAADPYAQTQNRAANARLLPYQGGEALFKNVCQACHMPDARGAPGAYPALAQDSKLAVPGYPISIVVNGSKAMPSFARTLSDQQIADAINYVRTHFGNNYKDKISPADVKALRP